MRFPSRQPIKGGKKTESVELTNDERIVQLERMFNLEKDKAKMVSRFILVIFITRSLTNLFVI